MKKKLLAQLKRVCLRLLCRLPHKLPVGLSEFDQFCLRLFEAYQIQNLPSYRQAIATMIMHLAPTQDKKAPIYFAKSIKKAMSNEVAYNVIQQIKADEKLKLQKEQQEKLEIEKSSTNGSNAPANEPISK